MAKKPELIHFSHVSFGYPGNGNDAIHDLSMHVNQGEITIVIGPNGSGKTTLLNLMVGLLRPKTGTIQIREENINRYSPKMLSRIFSIVPQREHIPHELEVQEYILLGRARFIPTWKSPTYEDYSNVDRLLDEFNLPMLKTTKVQSISGGELQRVRLARAMAQEPTVLLLDEPTTHLDLKNRKKLLNLLVKLKKTGITIILSTHDAEAALAIGENFILLNNGKLTGKGNAEELMTSRRLSSVFKMPLNVIEVDGRKIVI
jgi:iron complex transport system ATP-binding protein